MRAEREQEIGKEGTEKLWHKRRKFVTKTMAVVIIIHMWVGVWGLTTLMRWLAC